MVELNERLWRELIRKGKQPMEGQPQHEPWVS